MNYFINNFNPKNKKGNSVIEVVVVIVIITIGLVGAYNILNSGTKLALTTENRIKATNIAREGMEAMQNIRDTNWIKFSSDYTNCWNAKDYSISCIGDTTDATKISSGSYTISQNGSLWYLNLVSVMPATGSFSGVIKNYPIYFDDNGFVTQTGSYTTRCSTDTSTGCVSIFSRELLIDYPDTGATTDKRMRITSRVKWVDGSKMGDPYNVTLSTILTNWKEPL